MSPLPNLTPDELDFLSTQGLSVSDVFDCGNRSVADCNREAKAKGQNILIHGKCAKGGHRLKTRYGHCVQCDTSRISHQGRKSEAGVVYLMYSTIAKLTKVGFSANIGIREAKIRHDLVAGVTDWTLVFYLRSPRAGELELETHKMLQGMRVQRTYIKEGRNQVTKECYECSPLIAVKTILECRERNSIVIDSKWLLEGFNWNIR